jgi:hypothetical protein
VTFAESPPGRAPPAFAKLTGSPLTKPWSAAVITSVELLAVKVCAISSRLWLIVKLVAVPSPITFVIARLPIRSESVECAR